MFFSLRMAQSEFGEVRGVPIALTIKEGIQNFTGCTRQVIVDAD